MFLQNNYLEQKSSSLRQSNLSGLETVKGFEFSRVFIVGIGDQFPDPLLPKEEAWRDVRRLYVALTRARDEVVLTYTGNISSCLIGLEEFLSETDSAEQIDTFLLLSESDGESISVSTTTALLSASDSHLSSSTFPASLPINYQSESLSDAFKKANLEVHDKRDRGGCFWVIGGDELQPLMDELTAAGFRFSFTPNGSRTTGRRPAWYLK